MAVAATVAAVGLVATVLIAARSPEKGSDEGGSVYARAACDLTAKAEEASAVESDARYAASTLLLDRAILESGRAVEASEEFAGLDTAVQAAHTAAHQGTPQPWREALDSALEICRDAVG